MRLQRRQLCALRHRPRQLHTAHVEGVVRGGGVGGDSLADLLQHRRRVAAKVTRAQALCQLGEREVAGAGLAGRVDGCAAAECPAVKAGDDPVFLGERGHGQEHVGGLRQLRHEHGLYDEEVGVGKGVHGLRREESAVPEDHGGLDAPLSDSFKRLRSAQPGLASDGRAAPGP